LTKFPQNTNISKYHYKGGGQHKRLLRRTREHILSGHKRMRVHDGGAQRPRAN
jgi:hypothetical protein